MSLSMMLPWVFNVYIDDCLREMKTRIVGLCPGLKVRAVEQSWVAGLCLGDSVKWQIVWMLQNIVDELDRVCKKGKFKVSVGKETLHIVRIECCQS